MKSILNINQNNKQDSQLVSLLMLTLDQEGSLILRDASFQCIRQVNLQGKDILILMMLNGCMLKNLQKNLFSLLMMVLLPMIVFKEMLEIVG